MSFTHAGHRYRPNCGKPGTRPGAGLGPGGSVALDVGGPKGGGSTGSWKGGGDVVVDVVGGIVVGGVVVGSVVVGVGVNVFGGCCTLLRGTQV